MTDAKSENGNVWVSLKREFLDKAINVELSPSTVMQKVIDKEIMYEVLGFQPVKPFADFELNYKTMDKMLAARTMQLAKCCEEGCSLAVGQI